MRHLKKYFALQKQWFFSPTQFVRAVDNVSFTIEWGETLGLVGESGSGKTTVGRLLLRAIDPDAGEILAHFGEPVDLAQLKRRELRAYRPSMQMIFQDPYESLNPRMTVRDIIADPLVAMNLAEGQAINDRVVEIAERCQLNIEHLRRFPHAFSGGRRQRISIARALITQPEFVVCDEAVSALDVSICAEILNLLEQIRQDLQLTFLFVAHDLQVVQHICDRVAVMYVGQLVELGSTPQIFSNPLHPYTAALMSAIPEADPTKAMKPSALKGEIPNPVHPPTGCRFHTRCQFAQDICRTTVPEW